MKAIKAQPIKVYYLHHITVQIDDSYFDAVLDEHLGANDIVFTNDVTTVVKVRYLATVVAMWVTPDPAVVQAKEFVLAHLALLEDDASIVLYEG